MNHKRANSSFESIRDNARLQILLKKMSTKLRNFNVVDPKGELIGKVNDLILNEDQQLNLVVYKFTNEQRYPLLILNSKHIQKIDTSSQLILIDAVKAEIEKLSEYVTTKIDMEPIENSNIPVTSTSEADQTQFVDGAYVDTNSMSVISESQNNQQETGSPLTGLEDEIIRLIEERLVVERNKRKIGEVIVRKEIETRMVQLPVRREKLIVEQVSPEHKQLAEIDLGQEQIPGLQLTQAETNKVDSSEEPIFSQTDNGLTVRGEFSSPKIASLLLNAIAMERRHGCKKVRVEIVVEDVEQQKTYQEWIERSGSTPKR